MRTMRVYHHTFDDAGTKTLFLGEKPHSVLVKNMTDDNILFSWGQEIHTKEYVEMLPATAELIEYDLAPGDDLYVTIEAMGTGKIEIRIIDD